MKDEMAKDEVMSMACLIRKVVEEWMKNGSIKSTIALNPENRVPIKGDELMNEFSSPEVLGIIGSPNRRVNVLFCVKKTKIK